MRFPFLRSRLRVRGGAAALLVLSLLLPGCSSFGKSNASFVLTKSPLDRAVERSWRTLKIYNQLDTILIMEAILFDEEIAREYARSRAKSAAMSESEKEAIEREEIALLREGPLFLLSIYTSEPNWNDLEQSDSRWTLTLSDGSPRSTKRASSVKPVTRENLKLRDNLPFDTRLKRNYIARFPHPDPLARSGPYQLKILGILGEGELNWPGTEAEK